MENVFNLPDRNTIKRCNDLEAYAGRCSDLANDLLKTGITECIEAANLQIQCMNMILNQSGYLWHTNAHRGAK